MSLTSKYSIIFCSLMIVIFFLLMAPVVFAAGANGVDSAISGLVNTANTGGIQTSQTDLPTIIGKVVGAILAFVGVIFFCLIVWAGFGWMLAQGDEAKITKSKETIIGSVLGLIVILGAYAITKVIADVFSNALK